MAYTWDDREGTEHAQDAVLRDVRQPRGLPRRLGGGCRHGRLPWETSGVGLVRRPRPGSCTTSSATSRRPSTWPRRRPKTLQRPAGHVPRRGDEVQRAAARRPLRRARGCKPQAELPARQEAFRVLAGHLPRAGAVVTQHQEHRPHAGGGGGDPEGRRRRRAGLLRRRVGRIHAVRQGRQAPLGAQLVRGGPIPGLVDREDPAGAPSTVRRGQRSTRKARPAPEER